MSRETFGESETLPKTGERKSAALLLCGTAPSDLTSGIIFPFHNGKIAMIFRTPTVSEVLRGFYAAVAYGPTVVVAEA